MSMKNFSTGERLFASDLNGNFTETQKGENITSGTVAAARIADLAASKITSGTFADARIPNLAAGKITSGTFNAARIPGLDASKITTGKIAQARLPMKRVVRFTGSGSWTPPAGVTYAIAHMRGGGGGIGQANSGGAGGNSSVAFASGTVTANGGTRVEYNGASISSALAAQPNSGNGASVSISFSSGHLRLFGLSGQGSEIVAGAAVTPGQARTVTVGAGGSAGTSGAAGGSGYVWIEYYE